MVSANRKTLQNLSTFAHFKYASLSFLTSVYFVSDLQFPTMHNNKNRCDTIMTIFPPFFLCLINKYVTKLYHTYLAMLYAPIYCVRHSIMNKEVFKCNFTYGIRWNKLHKTSPCFINSFYHAWPLKQMSRCYNTKENWKTEASNT